MNAKQRLELRLNIYFRLTRPQRKKLNSVACHVVYDSQLTVNEFSKITKSKKLIDMFIKLKFSDSLRLVA